MPFHHCTRWGTGPQPWWWSGPRGSRYLGIGCGSCGRSCLRCSICWGYRRPQPRSIGCWGTGLGHTHSTPRLHHNKTTILSPLQEGKPGQQIIHINWTFYAKRVEGLIKSEMFIWYRSQSPWMSVKFFELNLWFLCCQPWDNLQTKDMEFELHEHPPKNRPACRLKLARPHIGNWAHWAQPSNFCGPR